MVSSGLVTGPGHELVQRLHLETTAPDTKI